MSNRKVMGPAEKSPSAPAEAVSQRRGRSKAKRALTETGLKDRNFDPIVDGAQPAPINRVAADVAP
jgi:hypothetical protein